MNPNSVRNKKVSYLKLALTFLYIGATTYGGMWAATVKLENEFVERHEWFSTEELKSLLVAATLIPAPKFISLGGLIGFHLRGWLGSTIAVFSIILPGSILVLLGVILIGPSLLNGPLAPLQKVMGIAIVGLIMGNSLHQLKNKKLERHKKTGGTILTIGVAGTTIAGVPLLLTAVIGFIIGAFLIRRKRDEETHE